MKKVYVFLADGFEEIEGLAVVDLLRRADIEVRTVSISNDDFVTGSHNIVVKCDTLFQEESFEDAQMLVLPGGMPGTKSLQEHEGLGKLLLKFHEDKKWLVAICAAPSVLGHYGILQGERAVCFPGFEDKLHGATIGERKVEVSHHIITSKGMGTAIDFGLMIIAKLRSEEVSRQVKDSILYEK
ncbi:MAG TPA: DJ-1/PfpI family protein [Candidatus Merdenecus merdavium]|nr:DJ-1/PfpI family protein [Candidatus Merdenecus merdavium]